MKRNLQANNLVVGLKKQIFSLLVLTAFYSSLGLSQNYTEFHKDAEPSCASNFRTFLKNKNDNQTNKWVLTGRHSEYKKVVIAVHKLNATQEGIFYISKFRLYFPTNTKKFSFVARLCLLDDFNRANLSSMNMNNCTMLKNYSQNVTEQQDYKLDLSINLNTTKQYALVLDELMQNGFQASKIYEAKNNSILNQYPGYEFKTSVLLGDHQDIETKKPFHYFADLCYKYPFDKKDIGNLTKVTNNTKAPKTEATKGKNTEATKTGKKTKAPKTEATKGKNTEATKDGKKTDAPKTEATKGKTDKTKQKPKPETKPNTKKKANPTKKNSAFTLTAGKPIYLLGLVIFLGLL